MSPPHLSDGIAHILVDRVGHLCSFQATAKLHVQDTWVVPEPPVISFVTRQPSAVDTRLLPRTNTNNLWNTGEETLKSQAHRESFLIYLPGRTCPSLA